MIYAEKGEQVTCENGHAICKFAETVLVGELQKDEQKTDWQQEKPKVGSFPRCAKCEARFYVGFPGVWHFADGWRVWEVHALRRYANVADFAPELVL